jgi:hypothetical protein
MNLLEEKERESAIWFHLVSYVWYHMFTSFLLSFKIYYVLTYESIRGEREKIFHDPLNMPFSLSNFLTIVLLYYSSYNKF